jgi:hypothetical protein
VVQRGTPADLRGAPGWFRDQCLIQEAAELGLAQVDAGPSRSREF